MVEDPDWPRASAWLAGTRPGAALAVLGVPLSVASISPSGADATPAAVREALRRYSTFYAPAGVDLRDVAVDDLGDLDLGGLANEDAQAAVATAVTAIDAALLVLLGGDNAITRPALRARSRRLASTGLLTLDAHHDVRTFHAGPSNGTPVRGLIDDGLPGDQVVQIGIGAFTNSHTYRAWCDERGITLVGVAEARSEGVGACVARHLAALAQRCEQLYVDLDVDVLDAAFAPGCPGARPGGLWPSELHDAAFAAGADARVATIDVVEVDATRDPTGVTVDQAALCLLHAAAGFATR